MTRRVIPDYANQLDLFSGAPDEAPVPVTPAISAPPYARPRQQQLDFGTYEPLPLEEDVRSPAARPTPASSGGDGDTAQQPPVQTGIGQQEKTSPDMGTGGRRDSSAGTVLDIEPEEKSSHDFRITSVHRIGQGSLHEKARDNITAIRLLKTLEAENRDATESETPARPLCGLGRHA
jgi:hypothetical protein